MVDIYDAYEIVEGFIDTLVTDFFLVLITALLEGFYDWFITFIFSTMDTKMAFLLVFCGFMLGFYYKFIYRLS